MSTFYILQNEIKIVYCVSIYLYYKSLFFSIRNEIYLDIKSVTKKSDFKLILFWQFKLRIPINELLIIHKNDNGVLEISIKNNDKQMTNGYYNNNIFDKKMMVKYVSIIKYVSVRF